jgi:hypothetical protein
MGAKYSTYSEIDTRLPNQKQQTTKLVHFLESHVAFDSGPEWPELEG